MQNNPPTVIIVDDQPLFRSQFRLLLKTAGMQVIAEASDIPTACTFAQKLQPYLIIVDVILPEINGIQGISMLLKASPHSKIYLISSFADQEHLFQEAARKAGAKAFCLKDDLSVDLVRSWMENENSKGGR